MHLIQMLLPLKDNEGRRFPRNDFDRVRQELIDRLGGATAFLQAPAEGAWKDEGEVAQDDVVLIEVMTEKLDHDWWGQYREELKRRFKQEELIIRALLVDLL